MTEGQAILAVGALLSAALAASLLAGRMRVPGLVLFLALGMVLGTDVAGFIDFADYELARLVGIVALALILFEGGLTAGYDEIRPVLRPALSMAIVGTIATALIAGLTASFLFGLSTLEGMLLGAILSSTDGAAIFAVLRGSTLRRRLARTLEGEAGFNDPVAVLLVLGFIEWAERPDFGLPDMALLFVIELAVGLAVGLAVAWAAVQALRRTRLASAGLYPVASLAIAALAFGLAETLHGSGFLSVYVVGLALGSASIPAKRTITTFHAGLGWLAQVVMFLVLGLLVFPSQLLPVMLKGTVLAIVVAFVARPLAVWLATIGARFSWQERLVLGWAGLRGAVPVVLATFPVIGGVEHSLEFFNIVFFAVLLSTVLQGATFEGLARVLGVTTTEAALPAALADVGAVRRLGAEVVEFPVRPGDAVAGHRVRELGLPRDALLNIVVRGEQAILPRGSTRIETNDRLHILVRQEAAMELRSLLDRWRSGPVGPGPRKRPAPRATPRPLTMRPWDPRDGDPSRATALGGVAVADRLRTRRDGRPGSLVVLEDGRYAVLGAVVAVGARVGVQEAARRHLRLAADDAERAWWREVIGALAAPEE
ncbi:MAG TPA: potassium/proton antiporter [Solirubrobacteraceae bacterium]|nr:potassium/proton antiporter [Solirubrobacteraceae bacterium]